MAKTKELSAKAKEVLAVLRDNGPMTLAELKDYGVKGVNPAHLTALRNRGLVGGEKVEKEVVVVTKRKVMNYEVNEEALKAYEAEATEATE